MPPKQNIPILVVNLKRSKDRRSYMLQQLDTYGVRYQFFPAVDGKTLTPQQRACYSEEESIKHYYSLSDGEIGCALSHLQIYEKMVAEDIAELLILEDDAVIKKEFFPIIFQRAQWAPADWKILHFSSNEIRLNTLPYYSIDFQKRYRLYRYIDFYKDANCYIVNNETARWLINEGYPIHLAADELMARAYKVLRCYTIAPSISDINANMISTLDEERRKVLPIPPLQGGFISLSKKLAFLFSTSYSSYKRLRYYLKDIRNAPIILRNMLWLLSVAPFLKWRWKCKRIRIED